MQCKILEVTSGESFPNLFYSSLESKKDAVEFLISAITSTQRPIDCYKDYKVLEIQKYACKSLHTINKLKLVTSVCLIRINWSLLINMSIMRIFELKEFKRI